MTIAPSMRALIAARIRAAVPSLREVLLFGSQARGDASEESDVDLLLLVPERTDCLATAIAARRSLWGLGLGFDVLVLTLADWQLGT